MIVDSETVQMENCSHRIEENIIAVHLILMQQLMLSDIIIAEMLMNASYLMMAILMVVMRQRLPTTRGYLNVVSNDY
jgi:hypothetical protein